MHVRVGYRFDKHRQTIRPETRTKPYFCKQVSRCEDLAEIPAIISLNSVEHRFGNRLTRFDRRPKRVLRNKKRFHKRVREREQPRL